LREINMKTFIVMLALVGAVASEASAQTTEQQERTNVRRPQQVVVQPARRHAPNASQDVYAPDGTYVGSDPDPFIRDSMWFDSALQGND
jgi:hypothetical protein